MLRGLRFLWYGYLGRTLEIKSRGSRSFYINKNQNFLLNEKSCILSKNSRTNYRLAAGRVDCRFGFATVLLLCQRMPCRNFPCSNENSKTVVDEDSAECNMFSQGAVPLRLSKFVSLEIVAQYLYDHWPLWIRLAHRTARFYDICIRLYKTDDGWFDKWFEKLRRSATVVTAGFDAWFVKMLYDMHLSDVAKMGLRSCVERSVYWHDLAERLTLLEERRNERTLF